MPDITYLYLPEGEEFDADSLNTRFGTVVAGMNGLLDYSSQRGAFSDQHLTDQGIVADEQFPVLIRDIGNLPSQYNTVYTTWGGNGTFPATGDSDREVISAGGVGETLEIITSSPIQLGMSNPNGIAGLLVLLNVHYMHSELGVSEGDPNFMPQLGVMVCIQWTPDGTEWFTFRKTERFQWARTIAGEYSALEPSTAIVGSMSEADQFDYWVLQDIPLRTLILPEDLPDPDQAIEGIRAAVATWDPGAIAGTYKRTYLREANLTVLPLHAGV
jgi:hypothetical protein